MRCSPGILLGLLLCALACAPDARPAEPEQDYISNGIRLSELRAHPVRSSRYWQQRSEDPSLQARIGPAPPELIDFMRLDNTFQGYRERPEPASAESAFVREVSMAVASLPPSIQAIADRVLVYVALVRDLGGGTGYMDVVSGADGAAVGGFIVLDEGALDRTANAWASWKEESAFRPSADWRLDVRIETPDDDTRVNAIRFILLHELGHVIDAVLGITQIAGGNTRNIFRNGFYTLSWAYPPPSRQVLRPGDALRSRFDLAWPERETLAFYAFDDARHDLADARPIYQWLQQTNFPTLYAATSSADDFADSFASYVHVVMDQRPYGIWLHNGAQSEFLFGSCWDLPVCATKRAKLEQLLGAAQDLP
jgi:hypothetical protein